MKSVIRNTAQNFTRHSNTNKQIAISQLIEHITHLETTDLPLSKQNEQILQNSKLELEELINADIKGVMFRTKAQWHELGEKNSQYFYNLEKSKYNAKVCNMLITDLGEHVQDPKIILSLQKQFYQQLYTSDPEIHFEMANTGIKISDQDYEKQTSRVNIT